MSAPDRAKIDFFSQAHHQDPYVDYAYLRQNAPIYETRFPESGPIWVITRYQDVMAAFKDPRFIKNYRTIATPAQLERINKQASAREFVIFNHNLLSFDPPNHTRLRGLVSKAFTPRRIEELRPRINQIADELLDSFGTEAELDLIDRYAFPLPIQVITEMLGIAPEDRHNFRTWSNSIVDGSGPAGDAVNRQRAARDFINYIEELIEQRREKPTDDIISGLVQVEDAGDKLSQDELIALIWLLILAGHETTVNLIGNGMLALFQHPDQLARLKAEPELMKSAVEELLRYDGSVETSTSRFVAEDLEFAGQRMSKGDRVLLVIAGADRDETVFPDADALKVDRSNNQHLAFGQGLHYCLGAPLARLEGQIALSKLIERFPNLHLAVPAEALRWRPSLLLRGLQNLPVRLC